MREDDSRCKSCNFACKNQHDVLFIDADMRKPYVYKLFDKKPESNAEVTDILLGRTKRLYVHRDALTGVNLILGSKSYEKSDELLGSTLKWQHL